MCWFKSVAFNNVKIFSAEKISKKFEYLAKIYTFLVISKIVKAFLAGCIAIINKKVIYTI